MSDSKEKENIIKDSYDAIVVGAGIGGLASASILAHEGVCVLLVEQSHKPGGLCTCSKRGEFTFDIAPTKFNGLGELGFSAIRRLFDFLGEQLEITPKSTLHTIHFGDRTITVHTDLNAYTSELAALFPEQAGSIIAFFKEMEKLYHHVLYRSGPPRPRRDETLMERLKAFLSHPTGFLASERASKRNLNSYLSKYPISEEFKSFLNADIYLRTGMRIEEITASAASVALIDHHVGGIHYPLGGSQRIADRLEKSINENGGEIVFRTKVERLILEGGRACGVRLSDGRAISAPVIISNVPPDALLEMDWAESGGDIGEPESERESRKGLFAIYAGVPSASIPDDFDSDTVVIPDPIRKPFEFISLSVPSLLDESLAPEGFHSISLHTLTESADWPSPDSLDVKEREYREKKEEKARQIAEKLKSVFPLIFEDAVIQEVATPTTFERYTGRREWTFKVPRQRETEAPVPLSGARTHIPGLLLTGSQTVFGTGAANACAAGINAALVALKDLERNTPVFAIPMESKVIETIPVRHEFELTKVIDAMSAVFESRRCLKCEKAPCVEACPAQIDIPTFLRRTSAGNLVGAALTIRERNPLGAVCGIVCQSKRLCERLCVLGACGPPVRIAEIEAYLCSSQREEMSWPAASDTLKDQKIAVIGSGPAGISCAYFLSLLGYRVDIIEAMIEAGGIPSQILPSFRLDRRILENDLEGAFLEGITFRGNVRFGEDVTFESLWREGYRAMFIGTGARHNCDPQISRSDIPGVVDGISFLAAARRKVKRELTPRVAVYGCGRLALDTAILAKELGAKSVYLVTWQDLNELLESCGIGKIDEAQIQVIPRTAILSAHGQERLERISLTASTDSPCEPKSETTQETGKGEIKELDVGTLIIATPRDIEPTLRGYLASHLTVRTDGTILVDNTTMSTSMKGVFAGGDVVGSYGMAQACADGRKAAISIDRYFSENL